MYTKDRIRNRLYIKSLQVPYSTFIYKRKWLCSHYEDEEFIVCVEAYIDIELGVGYNTPGIIKYPFWQYTLNWEDVSYVCINKGQAGVPSEIKHKSICIDDDIATVITKLREEIR